MDEKIRTFTMRPAALRADIREVETRIRRHKGDMVVALGSVTHTVGERMLSPVTIIAAGLLGAALQREKRLHGVRILSILHTANAGLRLINRLIARASALPRDPGRLPDTHARGRSRAA